MAVKQKLTRAMQPRTRQPLAPIQAKLRETPTRFSKFEATRLDSISYLLMLSNRSTKISLVYNIFVMLSFIGREKGSAGKRMRGSCIWGSEERNKSPSSLSG